MRQLRHLYLSEAYHSRFAHPHSWHRYFAKSLTQLQTSWGAFIDEDSPVIGGLNTLLNVRKLGLASQSMSQQTPSQQEQVTVPQQSPPQQEQGSMPQESPSQREQGLVSPSQQESLSSKLDAVADWIAKVEKLESLRLKSYDEKGEPSDLHIKPFPPESKLSSIYLLGRLNNIPDGDLKQLFPKTLIEITLSASKLSTDPMTVLGKLEKLQILQLFHESYEGVEMKCSTGDFPQLQVLKLCNLEKLEKWHVEKGALPSLADLEIRSCTSLAELPEELSPKLEILKLCNMEKLEKCHVEEGALPSLTDLEIRSCTSLAELPKGLQRVITLKELKLSGMPDQFVNKIKNEESQAWDKIKPRDHPEENQMEDMVLLRKLQR